MTYNITDWSCNVLWPTWPCRKLNREWCYLVLFAWASAVDLILNRRDHFLLLFAEVQMSHIRKHLHKLTHTYSKPCSPHHRALKCFSIQASTTSVFFTKNPHPFLFFIPKVLSSIIAFFIRSSDLRLGPPPPFFLPPPPPFFFFFGIIAGNPSYPDRFFQLNEWRVEVQIKNFGFRWFPQSLQTAGVLQLYTEPCDRNKCEEKR